VWIDNALMKHLARGIVWMDQRTLTSFRVADDGSLSTSNDVAFTLAADATVMVLHPLRAPQSEIDRWRLLFADCRIIQPFAQLERASLAKPSGGRAPWAIVVGSAHELSARILRHGFRRSASYGGKWCFRRELVAHGEVGIEFKGTASGPAEEIELVFDGEDLDMIEIADIIDELQSAAPSSARLT
jgi:hypothetical protein